MADPLRMTRRTILERAVSTLGQGCQYRLGRGGMNPHRKYPWDAAKQCDCTGWLAWVLGVSRKTDHAFYLEQNGGWFESTALYRDALSPFGFVQAIRLDELLVGDVLVRPDRGGRQGHVRLVTEPKLEQPIPESGPLVEVMECSAGSYRMTGDAIARAVVAVSDYLPVRFAWVVYEEEKCVSPYSPPPSPS